MLYDPAEVQPLIWDGISGKLGWDIGAGIGNTLPEMIARFENVVAFEPNKDFYNKIVSFGKIDKVRTLNLAIYDQNAKVDILGLGKVSCRTIDSLMKKLGIPDFIKIDVEYGTFNVLDGARFLFTVAPPHLLMEIYRDDIGNLCMDLLQQYGYYFDVIRNPTLDPKSYEWNNHYWVRAYVVRFEP